MFPGIGTAVNIVAVLLGASIGVLVGNRLSERTRSLVTDALGLVTLMIAGLTVIDVRSPALETAVGPRAPVLIVLGALLIGGIIGSLLRIEDRLESLGAWLRDRLTSGRSAAEGPSDVELPGVLDEQSARHRFVEGFVSASLLFCIGPLTILGALNDGLGRGADQLYVKSALDGFAAIAFAASFGWGVAASVLVLAVVQGGLTLTGVLLGDVLPDAHVAAISAAGGLVLVALAFGLLRLRRIPVGDLLPALIIAPLITQAVVVLR